MFFAALQTHDRGDFVAALWLSSRYSHTSLLSYALPYSRVVDKTPPACSTLRSPATIFTFTISFPSPSGAGTVNPLFCYLIPALSASRIVLFSWSSLVPIVANRFLKSQHSFHIYYIRKNTPPYPPIYIPPGPAVTYYNDTYTMPSRLVSTLHPHRIALHLASYTYHRHRHHPPYSSSAPSS